jgi:hypothetical protein
VLGTGGAAGGPGSIPVGDNYWFVDSNYGNDGNPGTYDLPFATLARALVYSGIASIPGDDVIVLKTGHAETVATVGAITVSVSNIRIVGLGTGANRPTFTFNGVVGASILISGSNVSIDNVVGVAGLNSLTNPFNVTGNNVTLNIEWQDVAATYEAVHVVQAVAVSGLTVSLRMKGLTGGSLNASSIYLNGCSEVEIFLDYYGKSSVAAVNFFTTACTGVRIFGQCYISGTTNSTKIVVDTIGGSTWWAEVYDGSAGVFTNGGSASAGVLSPTGTTAISNALYGTGVVTWPASAAHGNLVSMAAVLGYIQDNIITTGGTALPATQSLYGILGGTQGLASWPTAATYANGVSLAAVLGFIQNGVRNGTGGTALATNKSLADALGTDGTTPVSTTSGLFGAIGINSATNNFVSSAVTANRTGSIFGRLTDMIDQEEKCVATGTAVIASGTASIFTVAGGPIIVKNLIGVCVTLNGATATTLKFTHAATIGGAVDLSAASASLANAAAGTLLSITGTFANATVITAPPIVIQGAQAGVVTLAPGILQTITAVGATTGTWYFALSYIPLQPGVTVTAAY